VASLKAGVTKAKVKSEMCVKDRNSVKTKKNVMLKANCHYAWCRNIQFLLYHIKSSTIFLIPTIKYNFYIPYLEELSLQDHLKTVAFDGYSKIDTNELHNLLLE